jgi:hypothetical protein
MKSLYVYMIVAVNHDPRDGVVQPGCHQKDGTISDPSHWGHEQLFLRLPALETVVLKVMLVMLVTLLST